MKLAISFFCAHFTLLYADFQTSTDDDTVLRREKEQLKVIASRIFETVKLFPCHFAKRELPRGNKSESKQNIYRVM